MTEFFNFDDLTWPEVAGLPRDLPLVLPLGFGYPLSQLADGLGRPQRISLLPTLPFGWRGSGLEVPEPILAAYVNNLLSSIRDDGFTLVFALAPQGIDLGPFSSTIHLHPRQAENGLVFPPDSARGKVILIPIGHTEQHALHLPLSVDTISIDAVAAGTAAAAPEQAYSLPVMPYGVSTHRASFAATMNAGGRAFEDFWCEVVNTLSMRGFDRFYLLSGHGGNSSFLVNVIKYMGERHRRIFCATAFLYLSGPDGIAALEKYRTSKIGGMGHACELETSFMLHLRPDLVHMERVMDDIDFVTTPSYYMDWVEGGALVANPPWDDDSVHGAYGAGSHATAEKGRLWLEAAILEKLQHVSEIHEQHTRREKRRQEGFGLWGLE
ncbi:MAG: creatininase family protein [Chloroflexi bacterium]|nr:creatininase family protein [Chloroflexota bacterium]